MPIMQLYVEEGRTDEQKAGFIAAATEAAVTHLNTSPEKVRIIVIDLAPNNFGKAGKTLKQIRADEAAQAAGAGNTG